ELAQCLKELRRYTGSRVNVVAHSAGGLVARAVLQQSCPGIDYRHEVRRLITIGTPHLGAALAFNFGSLLGIRASSLSHDAGLIRRLNSLDLPESCDFASLVIRGLGVDVRGDGVLYNGCIDAAALKCLQCLPIDYQEGGDQ